VNKTLLAYCSNRASDQGPFFRTLFQLASAGVRIASLDDCSDVYLARNVLLSRALAAAESGNLDTIVLVDDDMSFTLRDVVTLVDRSRQKSRPVSGCYVRSDRTIVAHHDTCWTTGLGFLAVPTLRLRALAETSPVFRHELGQDPCYLFVETRLLHRQDELWWQSEDYCLTRRLGDVELYPLPIGHRKTVELKPTAEQINDFLEESLLK